MALEQCYEHPRLHGVVDDDDENLKIKLNITILKHKIINLVVLKSANCHFK